MLEFYKGDNRLYINSFLAYLFGIAHQVRIFFVIYMQGQFFIISLSGSVMLSKSSRTCDLSVMLSRSDHIVLGGCVAGKLIAATPVQVLF